MAPGRKQSDRGLRRASRSPAGAISLEQLALFFDQPGFLFEQANFAPGNAEQFVENASGDRDGEAVADKACKRLKCVIDPRRGPGDGWNVEESRTEYQRHEKANPGAKTEMATQQFA